MEGCTRSLLKEKNYFRRYRCCKEHSRSPMVVIDGEQKRFCQQCCSFHPLEAFDGDRRWAAAGHATQTATRLLQDRHLDCHYTAAEEVLRACYLDGYIDFH